MTTAGKASFSNVGQNAKKAPRKRSLRTIKISARLTAEMAAAKPPEVSWGVFLSRLLATHAKRDPYAVDRTRYAAWAAVSLDYLVREIPNRFPNDGSQPVGERLNRLEKLANQTREIAALRMTMEEIIHAH